MKLYGVPGWACQSDYFNFLQNTHSFDWHFYSDGNSNPEEFIGDIEENFVYICYSMGSLYINEALKNSYCKVSKR